MLVKSSGAQEIVPTRPLAGSARHRTGWTRWLLRCHTQILGSQPNLLGCRCDPARKVTCASPEQSLRWIRGWRRWRGRRLTTPGPRFAASLLALRAAPSRGSWGSSLLSPPGSPATTRGPDVDPALEQPGTAAAVLCSRWEVAPNLSRLGPPLLRARES